MYKVKRFSIQSGRPDKSASLGRELANRAGIGAAVTGTIGAITGGVNAGVQYMNKVVGSKYGLPNEGMSGKDALIMAGLITVGTAAFGALAGALTAMGADGRRSKATRANMTQVLDQLDVMVRDYEKSSNTSDINIFRYIETDKDPKDYYLTMAYEDGCAIMLIRNPKNELLAALNEGLNDMIKLNRKADYTSEELQKRNGGS